MTSHTSLSWDFGTVYNLLESFRPPDTPDDEPSRHQSSLSPPRIPSPSGFDPKITVPENLGDFNRLYEFLGLPTQEFPARPRNESIESSSSDPYDVSQESTHSSPPSSIPDSIHFNDFVDRKVRWRDEIGGSNISTVKARPRSLTRRKTTRLSSHIKNSADFDSETEAETFIRYSNHLVPAWVTPQPQPQPKLWLPPIPKSHKDPTFIQPIDTLTIEEKRAKLLKKLRKSVGFGPETTVTTKPLHIFVDCSNIIIGFYNGMYHDSLLVVQSHTDIQQH
jgi:hypothetical protein